MRVRKQVEEEDEFRTGEYDLWSWREKTDRYERRGYRLISELLVEGKRDGLVALFY